MLGSVRFFFFSSRRRHTRLQGDWSSDVCSSDLLDTQLFHPTRRDPAFFEKFGAKNGQVRLLYVGRVSREKGLDLLGEAFRRLRNRSEERRVGKECRSRWSPYH